MNNTFTLKIVFSAVLRVFFMEEREETDGS